MEANEKVIQNLLQELKRGSLVLAVLLSTDEPAYGYSLVTSLQESGIDVEQNTLYPLLRRLEQQGLMESVWDTGESRTRKYYRVTDDGREVASQLTRQWKALVGSMDRIIADGGDGMGNENEEGQDEDR
jgi:PadR family transcriptional regulator PadR